MVANVLWVDARVAIQFPGYSRWLLRFLCGDVLGGCWGYVVAKVF